VENSGKSVNTDVKKDRRIQATKLFLTIDQIGEGLDRQEPFDLKEIQEKLKEKYGDKIAYCCIGRERHIDKGWHTHIFLQFNSVLKFTYENNPFIFLCDKSVNIQVVKNTKEDKIRALSYTRKGGDFIECGSTDIDLSKQQVGNVRQYVTKMIQEGITLENLLDHEVSKVKDYVLNNSRKVKQMIYEIENFQHAKQMRKLKGIEEINVEAVEHEDWKRIAQVLNKAENKRPHKTLNLHLWSKMPNMGKTSLVEKIQSCSPCYIFPPDGWFTRYTNYIYQFIIWDEVSFVGLKPTFLNLFLEGAKCQMPVKGDLTHKWDNPLVIMLSNKPIKEHLKKIVNEREKEMFERTLGARVEEIEIKEPLFKFIELIKPKATAAAVD
jgi:hypothetical protein